ncbi:MAG: outer membrane protein [Methyloceanibacter sp.]
MGHFGTPDDRRCRPFTWSGFYIGGNAGAGFGGETTFVDLEGFNYFAANPAPGEVTNTSDETAFIGGAQIGYNHAFSNVIVGVEADLSGFDFFAKKTPASSVADWGSDTYVSVEMSLLATVRGRLGVAMDRWLVYGTAGVAFSDGEVRNHDFCNTVPPCGGGLIDARGDINTGWTVGGGAEFAWNPNWTIKAEYLFARFDGEAFSGTAHYPPPRAPEIYRFSASDADFNIVRAGLNYKFGRTVELAESLK